MGMEQNALETLVSKNGNKPIYNIIVSFDEAIVKDEYYKCGHVLIIDCIKDGKVYFSEMFGTKNGKIKKEKVTVLTIKEFKDTYKGIYKGIKGAARIYKK